VKEAARDRYDVVVIGGGIGGLTCAALLLLHAVLERLGVEGQLESAHLGVPQQGLGSTERSDPKTKKLVPWGV